MQTILKKILKFLKNFYVLSLIFFSIWMFFIDNNNILFQMKLNNKHNELSKKKKFYEDQILEIKNQRETLLNNPKQLEKLAREKYLMKKPKEDIYIVID